MQAVSETRIEEPLESWRVSESQFKIEWSAAVLDEIRREAVDGYFALPHGGAETGGVLFGTRNDGRVRILGFRALECEHALGPGFTLSENDRERLRILMDEGAKDLYANGWEVVGWYISHTRSEICLSVKDLEVYDRFFPEPWQVTLVVRPHAFKPTLAGFFVREADGSVHAESSYGEFVLRPLRAATEGSHPMRAVQAAAPVVAALAASGVGGFSVEATNPAAPAGAQAAALETGPATGRARLAARPVPRFLAPSEQRLSRRWPWWAALAIVFVAVLFAFKDEWIPILAHDRLISVSLIAYDTDGQLRVQWDGAAAPVRSALTGTLEITDGANRAEIPLDKQRLLSGSFSRMRQSYRVDVRLILEQPRGKRFEEFTSFVGPTVPPKPAAESEETAKLREELKDQATRTRRLERAIKDMRKRMRWERRRR